MKAMDDDRALDVEDIHRAALPALLGMDVMLERELTQRTRRINAEFTVSQHTDDIESLKKQLCQKDEEISDLKKAMKDLEERNDELTIDLKSRNEEIKTLKKRITRLETEKKNLEDELSSVKVKLGRVEKDIQDLTEAKLTQEETNLKLEENYNKVSGKMESMKGDLKKTRDENQALKKEVKELKEAQHRVLPPPSLGVQQQMLPPTRLQMAAADLPAGESIYLGEMCRQMQIEMYKMIFPNYFSSTRNYKMKNIKHDLNKLPQPEEDKKRSKQKWDDLQAKFNLDEPCEEAIKALQDTRNSNAHPRPLLKEKLLKSAEVMDSKGNLKGWLSLELVKRLIDVWTQLKSMD